MQLGVVRRLFHQCFRFVDGLLEALTLAQHLNVIDTCLPVSSIKSDGALEQEFCILQHTVADRDFGEDPHAVYVLWILLHELSAELFRFM